MGSGNFGMRAATERSKDMRERRRRQGVRELRLAVPDVRLETVRARIAAQVDRLDPSQESEALSFLEAVSEFDASDANGE